MKTHFCANCMQPVELNKHLRCAHCDSDAVDTLERDTLVRRVSGREFAEAVMELNAKSL